MNGELITVSQYTVISRGLFSVQYVETHKFLALVSTFIEIFSFLELQKYSSMLIVGGYHAWDYFMQWHMRYFDFAACTYVPHPEGVGNMFVRNVGITLQ